MQHPSIADNAGDTSLHCYVWGAAPPKLDLLLSKGADVNAVDSIGNTPLVYARTPEWNPVLIKFLLEHSADPNIQMHQMNDGNTVLHILVHDMGRSAYSKYREENYDIMVRLLEAGARTDIKNDSGKTPLSMAEALEDSEILSTFAKYEKNNKNENSESTEKAPQPSVK